MIYTHGYMRSKYSSFIDLSPAGSPFTVDKVKLEDLEAGNLNTSWGLKAVHKAVSEDQASALLKAVSIGILLSSSKGAWDISDDFNQLFPDHEFTSIEEFLAKVWEGKPWTSCISNGTFYRSLLSSIGVNKVGCWSASFLYSSYWRRDTHE